MKTTEKWTERVQAWKASGQSARVYCAAHGLNAGTLMWWSSRLGRPPEAAKFVRVVSRAETKTAKKVAADGGDSPIVIEVGGVRLAVRRGVDVVALREVLAVLGERR
jgi:hypothetical protein